MAVPFSNTKLRVPRGFQNLLEGLAKEVLRNQPENIYTFAAIYFDNLVKIREEQGSDPADIGAKHEDRYYNNRAFTKAGNMGDVSDLQQQEAATTIQAAVRGHQAREDAKLETSDAEKAKEEEASARVQAAENGEGADAAKKERVEPVDQEEAVKIDLNDPEAVKAATTIQASFRGYQTRKTMKDKEGTSVGTEPPGEGGKEGVVQEEVKRPSEGEHVIDIDLSDPEVEKAAVTIQGGFKMLKAKRQVDELRKAKEEETITEDTQREEEETELEEAAEQTTAAPGREEVDIDLDDPEALKAAEKIQATFRGYQTRKKLKGEEEERITEQPPSAEEIVPPEAEAAAADAKSAESELIGHIDSSDPHLNMAAAKIQAGYKGMKVRKELKEQSGTGSVTTPDVSEEVNVQPDQMTGNEGETNASAMKAGDQEEEVDIDLGDPELEHAALKIQAGFKGYKTRKELKNKEGETTSPPSEDVEGGEEERIPEDQTTVSDTQPIEAGATEKEDTPLKSSETPPAEGDILNKEENLDEGEDSVASEHVPPTDGDALPVETGSLPMETGALPNNGEAPPTESEAPPPQIEEEEAEEEQGEHEKTTEESMEEKSPDA